MFLNGSKLQIHDRTNFIFWVCRFACFAWFSYSYHVSCWIMMNYWWRKFNKAAVLTPGVFFLLIPSQITKIKIYLSDHRIARMWQMSVDWICWVVQIFKGMCTLFLHEYWWNFTVIFFLWYVDENKFFFRPKCHAEV